jgi:uracil-DNA glycosylase
MIDISHLDYVWQEIFQDEFKKRYFQNLEKFLQDEYQNYDIYPLFDNLFHAFYLTPFEKVKVIIVGQDPYHQKDQAQGLAFSVKDGIKIPPSLKNIFIELNNDIGKTILDSGDLTKWAENGVLLLNRILSVRDSTPNSHKNKGWEEFTTNIFKILNQRRDNLIFVLWGKQAQELKDIIDINKHYIIQSSHPSPLSAYKTFFGSKPFSQVNQYLSKHNIETIQW